MTTKPHAAPPACPTLARMLENSEARTARGLAGAIKTMRDACDRAEQQSKLKDRTFAVAQVMHALVWGLANAQSGIEDAMSAQAEAAAVQLAATATGGSNG